MSLSPSCPLCGDRYKNISAPPVAIGEQHFRDVNLGLSACRGCGVRFVNPRPDDNSLHAFYNSEGYDCHNPLFGSDGKVRLQKIQCFIKGGTLCDFGAGAGRLLKLAEAEGWRVCGVEAGRLARERLNADGYFVVNDLRDLAMTPDALSMVHVLEHLTSPKAILAQVRERLAKDGVFYVEVPNANSLRAHLASSPLKPLWTNAPEKFLAYPIHLFYFDARSLRPLLEDAGFQILEMGTLGMGVEELFASRPTESGSSEAAVAPTSAQKTPPRFQFVRRTIKNGFSRFRLGENLYAVCSVAER